MTTESENKEGHPATFPNKRTYLLITHKLAVGYTDNVSIQPPLS